MTLSLEEIVEGGLCIGCGLCRAVAGADKIRIVLTPEGRERVADLERRRELAEKLVGAAVWRAAVTCELCGAPGGPHCRKSSAWYMTLCPACAEQKDYVPDRESE